MKAKVVEARGEDAYIEISGDDCDDDIGHCGACGKGRAPKKKLVVLAKNPIGAAVNNVVECDLEVGAKAKSGVLIFMMPLMVLLLTTKIVSTFSNSLLLISLISFSALVITLAGLRVILKNKTYYVIISVKEN